MPVSIAINWNTDENFWQLHPVAKTIGQFQNLYKADKSRNKENSSQLMWAIALACDPNKNNFYRNINYVERKELIKTDYLKDKDFNWEHKTIVELTETYEKLCLTIAEKELIRFEEKLNQRGNFLESADYSFDTYSEENGKVLKGTADQLDKMMVNTGKLYDHLESIKDKMSDDEARGNLRGGEVESASESGLM